MEGAGTVRDRREGMESLLVRLLVDLEGGRASVSEGVLVEDEDECTASSVLVRVRGVTGIAVFCGNAVVVLGLKA